VFVSKKHQWDIQNLKIILCRDEILYGFCIDIAEDSFKKYIVKNILEELYLNSFYIGYTSSLSQVVRIFSLRIVSDSIVDYK